VISLATQYMASSDWKKRRAAVSAIQRLAEGSTKFFKKYFDASLGFLATAMQDKSPRVVFEGIQVNKWCVVLLPMQSVIFFIILA
jgi:hypothetical protein